MSHSFKIAAITALLLGGIPPIIAPLLARANDSRVVRMAGRALSVPEDVRRGVFGQAGSYDIMDYTGPRLWWHHEPRWVMAGLRFALFAVPFWFVVAFVISAVYLRTKRVSA